MPWFHEIQKGQRGRILQENYADEGEPASTETDPTSAENNIGIDEEAEDDDPFKDISYPAPILSEKFIQYGGFLLYLMGIMYSFLGISLITQNYINPAIDTIKKKGIIKPDTMNATLLAFSNSAAESFIVINSIFFGVSDIGIQTAVQQAAFSSLIIQGYFYTLTAEDTRIDWWISIRDSTLFIIYLGVMSAFMYGNDINDIQIYILIVLYIFHVILMKNNHSYEVALKKTFASMLEVRELNRLANDDDNNGMQHFHYNLDTRFPCIEMLNKINFRQEGDILIFENMVNKNTAPGGQFMARQNNQVRYRMKPIHRIRIREERFATPDNRSLMIRARFKQAVIKILTKL